MQGAPVDVGKYYDRLNLHFAASPDDADRNFPTICDKNAFKHGAREKAEFYCTGMGKAVSPSQGAVMAAFSTPTPKSSDEQARGVLYAR
jgi:hypothetical protein